MRFHIHTYGCQMNERDSEAVAFQLRRRGHEEVAAESDADLVLVNTCCVRGKAEDKALGKLGFLTAGKRQNPERWVGAIGCVVQRLGAEIFRRVPRLDFAAGTHALGRVPDIVERLLAERRPILDVSGTSEEPEEIVGHTTQGPSAFVNILLGCSRSCTYCVVPSVRGPERSRPAARVIEEVRQLARDGIREVVLLGQSVTRYGRGGDAWPPGRVSGAGFTEPLPRLLEALNRIEGLARIRFTSCHPLECTLELARAIAEIPAVCEHLHLPVQSGSDRILGRMGRGYTTTEYRAAVRLLRQWCPSVAISTDVIVGFPSETEDEFLETRAFMDEIGFDNAFIFKYSPRPGTRAGRWKDDVPDQEKRRRNRILLEDHDRRALEKNGRVVGSRVEVLAEGRSLRDPSRWSGRTRTNWIAVFEPSRRLAAGQLVGVHIERVTAQTLWGRIEEAA